MRILYLSVLLCISTTITAQMESGLISAEGFGSTFTSNVRVLGVTSAGYKIQDKQYGVMVNVWLTKNIFLGLGTGQLSYSKSTNGVGVRDHYEGQTYLIQAGYAAAPTPTSKWFAGAKIRYIQSNPTYTYRESLYSAKGDFYSAGIATFLGYRPCRYFMVMSDFFALEQFRAWNFDQGVGYQRSGYSSFTFNLHVHFSIPLVGKREKPAPNQ